MDMHFKLITSNVDAEKGRKNFRRPIFGSFKGCFYFRSLKDICCLTTIGKKLQNPVKETRYFYSANVTKALVCGFHMDKMVLRDTS